MVLAHLCRLKVFAGMAILALSSFAAIASATDPGWFHRAWQTPEIQDNGMEFEHAPDGALSDGLRNMQERLTELEGSCEIRSAPERGASIRIRLPLRSAAGPHEAQSS